MVVVCCWPAAISSSAGIPSRFAFPICAPSAFFAWRAASSTGNNLAALGIQTTQLRHRTSEVSPPLAEPHFDVRCRVTKQRGVEHGLHSTCLFGRLEWEDVGRP